MPGDDDNQNAAQNNAVALKLPTFWAHQPGIWFAQAEAQFTLHAITVDSTKYSYLIAALHCPRMSPPEPSTTSSP